MLKQNIKYRILALLLKMKRYKLCSAIKHTDTLFSDLGVTEKQFNKLVQLAISRRLVSYRNRTYFIVSRNRLYNSLLPDGLDQSCKHLLIKVKQKDSIDTSVLKIKTGLVKLKIDQQKYKIKRRRQVAKLKYKSRNKRLKLVNLNGGITCQETNNQVVLGCYSLGKALSISHTSANNLLNVMEKHNFIKRLKIKNTPTEFMKSNKKYKGSIIYTTFKRLAS